MAIYGNQQRFAVGPAPAVNREMQIISEDLRAQGEFGLYDGQSGTRSRYANRTRITGRRVGGPVRQIPTAVELAWWVQRAFGGTPTGNNYPLAEVLPTFYAHKSDSEGAFKYGPCGINRMVLSAAARGPLSLDIELIGTVKIAEAFPSGLTLDTGSVFIFPDTEGTFTLGGTAMEIASWTMTVDNVIDGERFHNTPTLTQVNATDRIVSMEVTLPYQGHAAMALGEEVGVPWAINFAAGNVAGGFNGPAFLWPSTDSTASGRQNEKMLTLGGMCRRTASALEVQAVIDQTP